MLIQEKKRSEELLTRLKYMQADFENYRKRTEKELKEAGNSSLRGLVVTLLSVHDELQLAVENARRGGHGDELVEGVEMVQKKLASALMAAGLERIDCVSKPFDPSLHEAVEKVQGTLPGEDTVLEEIRPGYLFRGRVVRPSMVKVELALKTKGEQEEKANE